MKIFKHLRDFAFEKNLKKDLSTFKRDHRQFNMNEVSTIGILYHFADEETDKLINEFVDGLKDGKRDVKVIGQSDDRSIPRYYVQKLSWFILNPRSVNWFYKPTAPFVQSFCEEEFDLLIDLSMDDYKPLIYTGLLSKAHFKVGRYTERNAKFYDLMIHSEQVQTLHDFIQHVRNYISKVNR
ncbi:MAG: hypothetical protein Q8908_05050 [Bacteroidota bacterium]|nr:hypothetical protein [Bacteroidota bacterium]